MATNTKSSKISRAARITAIVAGIQKHFLSQASLQLGNTSFGPAALIALLQADINLSNKATASRAQLSTDVEAAKQSHQTVDPPPALHPRARHQPVRRYRSLREHPRGLRHVAAQGPGEER